MEEGGWVRTQFLIIFDKPSVAGLYFNYCCDSITPVDKVSKKNSYRIKARLH